MKAVALAAVMLATTANMRAADNQDTTVVVPETGYLPIKPSRNFFGPANVIICSCFGSNTSGLYFTKFKADEYVVASSSNSSSGLFLVAKPGTYTLTLTDAEVTGRIYSTVISWQEEPGKAYKKDRFLYKYTVVDGQAGFLRDEAYASDNYHYCDLTEGEHIYLPLAEKNLAAIAGLLNTSAAELKFIPFNGPWKNVPTPEEAAEAAGVARLQSAAVPSAAYDLQGRRVTGPAKGIYIKNHQKVIIK